MIPALIKKTVHKINTSSETYFKAFHSSCVKTCYFCDISISSCRKKQKTLLYTETTAMRTKTKKES